MSSEKLDQLFAEELALYSDLEKLIAEYIQPLQSNTLNLGSDLFALKPNLLNKLQQKQQEITKIHQKQIEDMRLFCQDTIFEKNHPLFFKFVSQCLDFSNLPPHSDVQYLCYLSIYKLLSTAPGTALISHLYHRLAIIAQKIKLYPTTDESMNVKEKEFELYHPDIHHYTSLYASAGKQSNLLPQPGFILFGHELIHLLHHLLNLAFKPKESLRYFEFDSSNPKCWLYTHFFSEPERFAQPYEYITIEGRNDLLNGLCENRLRTAYNLSSRESHRAIKIRKNDVRLQQYFFLTQKLSKNEPLSFWETEALRFSKTDGTLPSFLQSPKNKTKIAQPSVEDVENSSACSFCSIL